MYFDAEDHVAVREGWQPPAMDWDAAYRLPVGCLLENVAGIAVCVTTESAQGNVGQQFGVKPDIHLKVPIPSHSQAVVSSQQLQGEA